MSSADMTAKIREWLDVRPMIFSIKSGNQSEDSTHLVAHLLPSSATEESMSSADMMARNASQLFRSTTHSSTNGQSFPLNYSSPCPTLQQWLKGSSSTFSEEDGRKASTNKCSSST